MSTAVTSAFARVAGSSQLAVPLRIAWLLNRPGTSGQSAALLPAVSFAVVTTLLLTVLSGALSFLQWGDQEGDLYLLLACFALILLVLPLVTLGGSAARLSARRRASSKPSWPRPAPRFGAEHGFRSRELRREPWRSARMTSPPSSAKPPVPWAVSAHAAAASIWSPVPAQDCGSICGPPWRPAWTSAAPWISCAEGSAPP